MKGLWWLLAMVAWSCAPKTPVAKTVTPNASQKEKKAIVVPGGSRGTIDPDVWNREWTFTVSRPVLAKLVYGPYVNELELANTDLPKYEESCKITASVKLERPEPNNSTKYTTTLNIEQAPANGDPPSIGSAKAIDVKGSKGPTESVVSSHDEMGTRSLPATFTLCTIKGENGKETPITLELTPIE